MTNSVNTEAVITTTGILARKNVIHYVDREGGTLQFLSNDDESEPKVVSLGMILDMDRSLAAVLPNVVEGVCAVRDSVDAEWRLEVVEMEGE